VNRRHQLNLHAELNAGCLRCPRVDRQNNTDDGLCTITKSIQDGAVVRCVGDWAQQKIHFLTQYLGIFAAGIPHKWGGHIHYIELCSGPGRCIDRSTGSEMDGSALAVLGHETFTLLETATFIDYNPDVVATLNARIARLGLAAKAKAEQADYYHPADIAAILSRRAARGLSLVFIDPTDCSLPFETVAAIANAIQKADFIINVATRTDATRNLKQAILNDDSYVRVKYIRFLGGDAFFRDRVTVAMAEQGRDADLRNAFRNAYRGALRALGYEHFAQETVKTYYDLLFASRHPLGLTFWRKAQQTEPDNQGRLDLA
jgi:three-Cys-motif partner protein